MTAIVRVARRPKDDLRRGSKASIHSQQLSEQSKHSKPSQNRRIQFEIREDEEEEEAILRQIQCQSSFMKLDCCFLTCKPRRDEILVNMRKAMSKFYKAWKGFDYEKQRKQKAFFMMKEEYQTLTINCIIDVFASD